MRLVGLRPEHRTEGQAGVVMHRLHEAALELRLRRLDGACGATASAGGVGGGAFTTAVGTTKGLVLALIDTAKGFDEALALA